MSMDVHYDSDVELAKKIILKVIEEHPYALKEPIPYVRVSEYKDHAITIGLRVWTKTENYYDLKDDLLEQIKYAFDKEGVQIPYQQFDIHVHHTNNS